MTISCSEINCRIAALRQDTEIANKKYDGVAAELRKLENQRQRLDEIPKLLLLGIREFGEGWEHWERGIRTILCILTAGILKPKLPRLPWGWR